MLLVCALWTCFRLAIAVVLCPPLGIAALVLLLLAMRARSRAVASAGNDPDGKGESSSKEQNLVKVANALIFTGIIFGALCYAIAGIAFGILNSSDRRE